MNPLDVSQRRAHGEEDPSPSAAMDGFLFSFSGVTMATASASETTDPQNVQVVVP